MKNIKDGIWTTMITPFTAEDKIDYGAVEALVEWYVKAGTDGIFAVCQSSEMFFLSFDERYELAEFITKAAAGKIEVIICGNVGDDIDVQIKEARAFAELSPQAVVFVSNRLELNGAALTESVDKIIAEMPDDIALGIYECPYPSKRVLTDSECEYLVRTGRFVFLKDTSCDVEIMRRRAEIVSGTQFKLYNANAATLYDTLKFGYSGYCGVMANFHPDLYVWLHRNMRSEKAGTVEKYLSMMSVIETRGYPYCAKHYLSMSEGLSINPLCRSVSPVAPSLDHELNALHAVSQRVREYILPD